MEENERLAVLMENAEQDVHHVTDLLDKSDKERKRLSERNAQLTINGIKFFITYFLDTEILFSLGCEDWGFLFFLSVRDASTQQV